MTWSLSSKIMITSKAASSSVHLAWAEFNTKHCSHGYDWDAVQLIKQVVTQHHPPILVIISKNTDYTRTIWRLTQDYLRNHSATICHHRAPNSAKLKVRWRTTYTIALIKIANTDLGGWEGTPQVEINANSPPKETVEEEVHLFHPHSKQLLIDQSWQKQ